MKDASVVKVYKNILENDVIDGYIIELESESLSEVNKHRIVAELKLHYVDVIERHEDKLAEVEVLEEINKDLMEVNDLYKHFNTVTYNKDLTVSAFEKLN